MKTVYTTSAAQDFAALALDTLAASPLLSLCLAVAVYKICSFGLSYNTGRKFLK
jgi:hypothetical protein